jgi:hypothetical protein
MPDKTADEPLQQALEQGYIGQPHDEIENDAYTLQGQGADTARRELEQRGALRAKFEDASRHAESTSSRAKSTKSSTSSSTSSTSQSAS